MVTTVERDKNGQYYKSDTLCWTCAKACVKGCSWSEEFKPVEGWTAELRVIGDYRHPIETYAVSECPEYQKDPEEGKITDVDLGGCIKLVEQVLKVCREDYILGGDVTQREIRRFLRGRGASRLHRLADPEGVIRELDRQALEHKKKRAQKIFIKP